MKPTLLHWHQFDILEKIAAGVRGAELLVFERANLIDRETGDFIMDVQQSWKAPYILEAFINVIETVLLSEQIDLVFPDEMFAGDTLTVPEYTTLLPTLQEDFIKFPMADPHQDRRAIDTRFYEHLFGANATDALMIAKAYNGQYGAVALRLTPSDHKAFLKSFEEFAESGPLTRNVIDRAYDELKKKYRLKTSALFRNRSDLVLPPLVTAFLDRLPDNCDRPDIFKNELLKLRSELSKTRKRFSEFQVIDDDPARSIRDAEKVISAINADAHYFTNRWDTRITENNLIQFCIDEVSFLVKLIFKTHEVTAEEIAGQLAKIAPGLEKRLRSSAPTVMSKWALGSRKIKGILNLLDRKLNLGIDKLEGPGA